MKTRKAGILVVAVALCCHSTLRAATSLDLDQVGDFQLGETAAVTPQEKIEALSASNVDAETKSSWIKNLTKEEKIIITNVAAVALITAWGLMQWDYGQSSTIYFKSEGWYEKDAKYGGADKCGHFYSTFLFAEGLSGLYSSWGYDNKKASIYGAISAWIIQALMEVGDGTSPTQGFSHEDMVMNTLGSVASVLMQLYPELDNKIDFRTEYTFNTTPKGFFDDYSNMYYSVVLKLDGFEAIQNRFLKHLEFHVGYHAQGYDTTEVEKGRSIYTGMSVNLSKIFLDRGFKKTAKALEYIQVPYTTLKVSHGL